jgi:nucleoside-diphosphate-sugar epimerase
MIPAKAGYSPAHVDDVVEGHILAMEKGRVGESYIIGGERYTLADAFQLAGQITGKRAPMVAPAQMVKVMSVFARPFDSILPPAYTSEGLRVIAGVTYMGDNSKAKHELGYDPRPFREGWEATLRHEMKLLGM